MKCHYEILGIARDADDSEIKTAYRKLALRWHPDKNLDNAEEAKDQFQLVQQAYEILSDPHERAWYDNHREKILFGRNSDYEDSCLDVFQYFTVSCFKGYDDNVNGFYQVYSKVFEQIATEDVEFMNKEEFLKIPKFGNSKSNYEDTVGPFYAFWQSYCTKKSFAWLCPYNINEVKDRRILREIEKEMKKIVQKAKRERNEEVRNLVSFVRKRDKRVQAYKKYLEEKAALNRQKQEQNRLEQIRRRNKEIEEMKQSHNQTQLNNDYEEQLKLLEQEYEDDDDDEYTDDSSEVDSSFDLSEGMQELDENNDESNEENSLIDFAIDKKSKKECDTDDDLLMYEIENYCIACNKQFKYQRAFKNHELSEKHCENVIKLKEQLCKEDNLYAESKNQINNLVDDNHTEKCSNNNADKINTKNNSGELEEEEEEEEDYNKEEDTNISTELNKIKSKKNKKTKRLKNSQNLDNHNANINNDDEIEDHFSNILQLSDKEDDNWYENNKKSNKKGKGGKKFGNQQKNSIATTTNKQDNELSQQNDIENKVDEQKSSPSSSSLSTSTSKSSKDTNNKMNEININHICVTCKSSFESKNKLFQHLKKMNHGVYIPKAAVSITSSGKSKTITTKTATGIATNKKGKRHK